jgi:hypothetical protein
MASNGAYSGNSDYSYLPLGWTCQTLLNTSTLNLGYDVKFNPVEHQAPKEVAPVKVEAPEATVAEPELPAPNNDEGAN